VIHVPERQDFQSIYCTFTALICKSLIINGAGEGNRTLVIIPGLDCEWSIGAQGAQF
jgi:hypothetical protein